MGASGTGAWSGHDGEIAFYASGWLFITVKEGFVFWVEDENVLLVYNGSSYQTIGTGAGGQALPLTFNFTDAADALFYADEAMTLTQQATSGTLTIAYEKSTNAAPSTFSSTTSPITLEAGAWLKVTASSVTAPAAVHLKRTA